MESNMNTSVQACTVNQNATINASCPSGFVPTINCDLFINQSTGVLCNMQEAFQDTQNFNLETIINNAISQTLSQVSASENDFLETAWNEQNQSVNLTTKLQTLVSTNIANIVSSSCSQTLSINSQGVLNICSNYTCPGGTSGITQQVQAQATCVCLTDFLSNIFLSDSSISAMVASVGTQESSSNSGVGSIIKSFFSSWVTIAIVAVILLAILGFFAYKILLSPAGQSSLQVAANTAAKKYGGYFY
jgi:hypothetical protein